MIIKANKIANRKKVHSNIKYMSGKTCLFILSALTAFETMVAATWLLLVRENAFISVLALFGGALLSTILFAFAEHIECIENMERELEEIS